MRLKSEILLWEASMALAARPVSRDNGQTMRGHIRKIDDELSAMIRQCIATQLGSASSGMVDPMLVAKAAAHDLDCPWEELMRPVRLVIAQMAHHGELDVLQDDHPVDILEARGPVMIRTSMRKLRIN